MNSRPLDIRLKRPTQGLSFQAGLSLGAVTGSTGGKEIERRLNALPAELAASVHALRRSGGSPSRRAVEETLRKALRDTLRSKGNIPRGGHS